MLGEGRDPIAPVGPDIGDVVADPPFVGFRQPLRRAERGLRARRSSSTSSAAPSETCACRVARAGGRSGGGRWRPPPRPDRSDPGPCRGCRGRGRSGADAHRDGEEADGLVGLAGAHQLSAEVGVDPEVVGVRPLGAAQQGDGPLAPAAPGRQGEGQPRDAGLGEVVEVGGGGEPLEASRAPGRGRRPCRPRVSRSRFRQGSGSAALATATSRPRPGRIPQVSAPAG